MTTKVVNIYTHTPTDNDVYIGRAGKGKEGYFGNPFILGKDGNREEILALYLDWVQNRLAVDKEFSDRVWGLRDKNLVCFCAPKLCHGDILVMLINARIENEG